MRNWIVIGLILLVVGLIGTFGTLGASGNYAFGTEKVEREQAVAADGIRAVELKTGSVDVKIVPGEGTEAKASLTGRASKKYLAKLELKLEKDGDTLKVGFQDHAGFQFGFNILSLNLKLELPKRTYERLTMNTGSGDIAVDGVQVDTAELKGGSGDVDISRVQAKAVTVSIGSGNLHFEDVTADDALTVKAASGDVTVSGAKTKLLSVDVKSGDVDLADADAELKVQTGSGDISAEQRTLSRPMTLRTGSGDVDIMTDEQPADAEIAYSSGSGDLDNDWDGAKGSTDDDGAHRLVFGSGSVRAQVRTGSGDLDVGRR
ncbi:Putative adhesin [Paenibacillus sp. UNC496MF]|uniref:DUF4097 family beta strand repeat-containing protein n=1 Tax=Paenibacillus sp. UNC496MF TaxID=1502753 RepID=UPI0008DF56AF|nr:DUF4097 family beta strand repeat-containing protein [Paenibacillus sp. UNC496MF]SFI74585.1 Putative adhesin [Paenibacillus sp. UNC496MF]